MEEMLIALTVFVVGCIVLLALAETRYALGRRRIEAAWINAPSVPVTQMGSTRSLAILPLVDWHTARSGLRGEAGVSYLVRTDSSTVLLDMGLNLGGTDPSPLLHNMRELGISLSEIDAIVISHNHVDHVGGLRWFRRHSFSLGNSQADLSAKRVYVPVRLTYPGTLPQVTEAPTVLAPGVATTGTIPGQLLIGRVEEQALAVNVEGKGVVLVVACGHQSVPKLLDRAKQAFGLPIYGVVGGLHYPIPHGRLRQLGLDLQKFLVFGLFHAPSVAEIQSDIDLLNGTHPAWVSLSGHDSSDETIDRFRTTFGQRYHDLRVGEWQAIGGPAPAAHAVRRRIDGASPSSAL